MGCGASTSDKIIIENAPISKVESQFVTTMPLEQKRIVNR